MNWKDTHLHHLLPRSWAEAGRVKLKFSTEPNYKKKKEISLRWQSSHLSVKPSLITVPGFNNTLPKSSAAVVRWQRRCFCWHMSVRVWCFRGVNTANQRNDSLKYARWWESGPSVLSLNQTRHGVLRRHQFQTWIMTTSAVAGANTRMSAISVWTLFSFLLRLKVYSAKTRIWRPAFVCLAVSKINFRKYWWAKEGMIQCWRCSRLEKDFDLWPSTDQSQLAMIIKQPTRLYVIQPCITTHMFSVWWRSMSSECFSSFFLYSSCLMVAIEQFCNSL